MNREAFQEICTARLLEQGYCSAYQELDKLPSLLHIGITGGTDWLNNPSIIFLKQFLPKNIDLIPANRDFCSASEEERHKEVKRFNGSHYTWVNAERYPELASYYARINSEKGFKLLARAYQNATSAEDESRKVTIRNEIIQLVDRLINPYPLIDLEGTKSIDSKVKFPLIEH